jgi:uncharacterized membrane protein (UPF0127 family)
VEGSPPPLIARRLRRLPRRLVLGHDVALAADRRSRLLGLSGLERFEVGGGLLIPRCASVHSFGMRFALDLVFLDRRGRPVAVRRNLGRRRLAWQRGAAGVLELPAPEGESLVPGGP